MIEAGLTALLNANDAVSNLASTRIYPLVLPETPTYPAATYQVISSTPKYGLNGALGFTQLRIEYNAWALNYAECKQLAAAIRNVLDAYSGVLNDATTIASVAVANVTDYYDSDARLYRVRTDYLVWATA